VFLDQQLYITGIANMIDLNSMIRFSSVFVRYQSGRCRVQ